MNLRKKKKRMRSRYKSSHIQLVSVTPALHHTFYFPFLNFLRSRFFFICLHNGEINLKKGKERFFSFNNVTD